jgi:hypothetical protein
MVPLTDFHSPDAVFYAVSFATTPSAPMSRDAIQLRTGLSADQQRRRERKGFVKTKTVFADFDHHRPTPEQVSVLGGVFLNHQTNRLNKQCPNRYQSVYPEAPYGRVRPVRSRFRRLRGRGQQAYRRERTKRYYEDIKTSMKATAMGMKPGERTGAIFCWSKEKLFLVRLPEVLPKSGESDATIENLMWRRPNLFNLG